MSGIQVAEGIEIPESQLLWSFARSSGPGGQNVNKVNTKATLRWLPTPELLPPSAWHRFLRRAARFLTIEGQIVIQSQEHRDRAQNMDACRQKLQRLLAGALVAPKPRVATKPSKASRQRRLDDKKRNAKRKGDRRWAE